MSGARLAQIRPAIYDEGSGSVARRDRSTGEFVDRNIGDGYLITFAFGLCDGGGGGGKQKNKKTKKKRKRRAREKLNNEPAAAAAVG